MFVLHATLVRKTKQSYITLVYSTNIICKAYHYCMHLRNSTFYSQSAKILTSGGLLCQRFGLPCQRVWLHRSWGDKYQPSTWAISYTKYLLAGIALKQLAPNHSGWWHRNASLRCKSRKLTGSSFYFFCSVNTILSVRDKECVKTS